jgi:hypothetical protein
LLTKIQNHETSTKDYWDRCKLFLGQHLVFAQEKDTLKTQNIEGVVVTALGIKREKNRWDIPHRK